ncbi:MAG: hypothetical protein J5I59_07390 [Saprospiraceae bacterium]|nr:hypothetical protein [Saprospiraceae bacterium]
MKTQHLIPLLFLVMTVSCEKEDIPKNCCSCTTPATMTGANTVSFDLNGATWSPCDAENAGGKMPEIFAYWDRYSGYNTMRIKASQNFVKINNKSVDLWITIFKPKIGITQPKIPIRRISLNFPEEAKLPHKGLYATMDGDLPFNLEVTRFDTINKIISGVFDCTIRKTNDSSDSTEIKLSNGRFDVRYIKVCNNFF